MIKKVTTPSQKIKKRVRNGYLLKLGTACFLKTANEKRQVNQFIKKHRRNVFKS